MSQDAELRLQWRYGFLLGKNRINSSKDLMKTKVLHWRGKEHKYRNATSVKFLFAVSAKLSDEWLLLVSDVWYPVRNIPFFCVGLLVMCCLPWCFGLCDFGATGRQVMLQHCLWSIWSPATIQVSVGLLCREGRSVVLCGSGSGFCLFSGSRWELRGTLVRSCSAGAWGFGPAVRLWGGVLGVQCRCV